MKRYHKLHPFEMEGYKEGQTYPDYHPLTRREIVQLLEIAQYVDRLTLASIQTRFLQAIPGSTYGPQRKGRSIHERLYPENAHLLEHLFATYAHIGGATPLLVQQLYDLTHPTLL